MLSPPIDWDFFPTFAQIWASKIMANKAIYAIMTKYKVVQNAGISLTKGACVTLEEKVCGNVSKSIYSH